MTQRVILLLKDLPPGGVERVSLNLAEGLRQISCSVEVVVFYRESVTWEKYSGDVRVLCETRFPGSSLIVLYRLLKLTLRSRIDLIIAAKEQANFMALLVRIAQFGRLSVVVTRHVPLAGEYVGASDATFFTPWLYKAYLACGCVSVAVSEQIARQIRGLVGFAADRVVAIKNPVVSKDVCRRPKPDNICAQVVSLGRLDVQKGFDVLIDAFAIVAAARADVFLSIYGEGPLRPALEEKIVNLELGERVALPGFVDDTDAVWLNADLFVLASRWEGLPTVLIEALARGVPVVSTDCETGPREILDNGRLGLLVPVECPVDLAEAILASLNARPSDSISPTIEEYRFDRAARAYLKVGLA